MLNGVGKVPSVEKFLPSTETIRLNHIIFSEKREYINTVSKGTTKSVNLENLEIMMLNHITTYKFSNIDYFNKEFSNSYYPHGTIARVNRVKYGICMDLNLAFSVLLRHLGYYNYFVRCVKPNSRSEMKGIFHLSLIVFVENKKYFCDVGYGEFFVKPVPLADGVYNHILVTCGNCDDFYIRIGKLTLKIIDSRVTLRELLENYNKFLRSEPEDMSINRSVFERIYDVNLGAYVQPKVKCSL